MRCKYLMSVAVTGTMVIVAGHTAWAQGDAAFLRPIETKYVFGFTDGSGIGLEGEREVSLGTEARIGKRNGHYFGSETKLEYEFTPSQFVQFEFGPFVSAHDIRGVSGLDNRNQVGFGGLFGEVRYLLVGRGPASPLGVTLSAEPEWQRIDETGGQHITNGEVELKVDSDFEIIKNRLYAATNLLYEPEATEDSSNVGAGWAMESKTGVSGALAFRVVPSVVIGGEVWYLRHYNGVCFNNFTGDAVYAGPTLYIRLSPKVFVSAAWNIQVTGSEWNNAGAALNLAEFSRQRVKLKVAMEF